MSALCALGGKQDLIDRVCVARDEKVGVYGFVFHRGKFFEIRLHLQMRRLFCTALPPPVAAIHSTSANGLVSEIICAEVIKPNFLCIAFGAGAKAVLYGIMDSLFRFRSTVDFFFPAGTDFQ